MQTTHLNESWMNTGRKRKKEEKERRNKKREKGERLQRRNQDLDFNQLKMSC